MKQGPSTTNLYAYDGSGRLPPQFVNGQNGQYRTFAYDGADAWPPCRRRVAAWPSPSDTSDAFLVRGAASSAAVPRMGACSPALSVFTRTIATVLATREV